MFEYSPMVSIEQTPTVLVELEIDILYEDQRISQNAQNQNNAVPLKEFKCDVTNCKYKGPFEFGWKRELVYRSGTPNEAEVYYITPSGKKLRNKKEIELQLQDGLDLTMFAFTKQPLGASEEHEIVRSATDKGYRQYNENRDPNLVAVESIAFTSSAPNEKNVNKAGTNCLHIDEIDDITLPMILNEQSQSQSKPVETFSKMDIAQLRESLIEKDYLIENLKACLARNEFEIRRLRTKIKTKTEISTADLQLAIRNIFPMLTSNQIKLMTNQKKRVNWTCEEIATGFTLIYFSRRGYVYLINKLKYPLPAIRTLQKWSENMTIGPGLLKDSFVVIQGLRNTLTEGESQVIISYHEMKCKSRYEYNKTLDSIMGPHSQMQTAMVRGLFAKFKQPIYIDFDKKMTPDLLNSFCTELHKVVFTVVGFVGDNGGGNVGLCRNCGVNFETHYIYHPVTGEKIFMFSDAPHLLKLQRNWFIDGGFLLPNGIELNQYKIRQLIKSNTEISPIFKLSLLHLEVEGAERQNVRMACELFSHTVAEGLRRNFPGDEIVENLSKFIDMVNYWWDIMNSYSPNGVGFKKPYSVDLDEQDDVLDEMYYTIKAMKCFNKQKELQNSLQIFQKGILMSINSIKAMHTAMNEKFGYNYLLTHRTNQDCLEKFFSQLRGRKEHPSPVECLYNVKIIVLGKNPGLSRTLHTNTVERDPEEYASATFGKLLSRENISNWISMQTDEDYANDLADQFLEDLPPDSTESLLENHSNDLTEEFLKDYENDFHEEFLEDYENDFAEEFLEDDMNDIPQEFVDDLFTEMVIDEGATRITKSTEDGIEYIAGWIAWKFNKANPEYSKSRRESLPSHITDYTYAHREGVSSSSWIDSISYGGLTKPTEQVLQWVRDLESVFLKMHGQEFNERTNVKSELVKSMDEECKQVPKEVIRLFAKSCIYMRCKYLNKKILDDALLNKIKRKKERATKRSAGLLEDISRSKAKKMKKVAT